MAQKHFSIDDKLLLISLVKIYDKVVENKRTDAVGNFDKDEAWGDITEIYNKRVVFKRNLSSLRNCWQHIKQCTRKNATQSKNQARATGGGVNRSQINVVDIAALEIIHPFSVEGLKNIFDSDAENECPNKVVFDHLLNTKEINKWDKWNPQKLKTSLSAPIRTALIDAAQPSTSTGITDTSRKNKPTTELLALKVEAFTLLKKSLTENQVLEKEYLKTKLEREKLELEILKANHFGFNKIKNNCSSDNKVEKNVSVHVEMKEGNDNELKQTGSNDDYSILLSSDSD